MATRAVLTELAAAFKQRSGQVVAIESVGGLDAARRVQAGEDFDVVVLAADAIDKLIAGGHLLAGSRFHLVRSGVAVAVLADAPRPDIGSEAAMREAVLSARSIGYSTGPSGVQLARLFERWGITERIAERIVQAPPGVPVGTLVARGEVELGFQQLSELMGLPGISVVGPLPPAIQIVTTFSAGIGARSTQVERVRSLLDFMASPVCAEAIRRHGMEPASIQPSRRQEALGTDLTTANKGYTR
ncbi:MAG: ABC transporter substrate-binding protein [Zoogloea sp.]|nr:MAG: ABC transporter substrate-binding protein [Zoogloea sp.]